MKRIYNIAVIVSCIDEEYQNKILCGITDYAKINDFNVSIFNAFGGNFKSIKQDVGEYNIYNLINYTTFDGIILLTNTITSEEVKNKIIQSAKDSNVCTVSIDNPLLDTYNIGIDNFEAMYKMVSHFIEHHNFTRINYVSGMDDNCDSQIRLDAYKKVLMEHNIPVQNERIYHGSFRYDDGVNAIEHFLNSNVEMPQAIVCANDVMALASIKTLQSHGLNVPIDVCVSGFDRIYDARNYYPEISTVERPLYEIGQLACEKINKHLQRTPQEPCETLKTNVIFTQSCGCSMHKLEHINEFRIKSYNKLSQYRSGVINMNLMACDLAETSSMEEVLEKVSYYVKSIECSEFYLCLCENWHSSYDAERGFIDNSITYGYTDDMLCMLSYKDGSFDTTAFNFSSKDMSPNFNISDGGNVYYYSPIHFHEKCLGYCIVGNSNYPLQSPVYHSWIVNLSTCIENIINKISLKNMVDQLDRLYVIDNLSKIYNRNGFSRFGGEIYRKACERKSDIMVLFIDLDGLKYINDKFGHHEGDNAIIEVANSIRQCCSNGEICARFGGDEFLVFASDYSPDDVKVLCENIEEKLKFYNSKSDKPYKVGASMGYHITTADENIPISRIISIADSKMYELKKQRRKMRGQSV